MRLYFDSLTKVVADIVLAFDVAMVMAGITQSVLPVHFVLLSAGLFYLRKP